MDYAKQYQLIVSNSDSSHNDEYTEVHHIVPRCLGGSNQKHNLVRLTYRKHFLCHWLLCKIHPENHKLKSAFAKMLESTQSQKRIVTSKQFESVKRILKGNRYPWLEKNMRENGPWNKGKIGLQTAWNKGLKMGPATEERKRKTSDTLKQRFQSVSHPRKNVDPWNKGAKGLQEAWNKGISPAKAACEHCGMLVSPTNMKRWHGDKCKLKNNVTSSAYAADRIARYGTTG
jgi:hypothetical protein